MYAANNNVKCQKFLKSDNFLKSTYIHEKYILLFEILMFAIIFYMYVRFNFVISKKRVNHLLTGFLNTIK